MKNNNNIFNNDGDGDDGDHDDDDGDRDDDDGDRDGDDDDANAKMFFLHPIHQLQILLKNQ